MPRICITCTVQYACAAEDVYACCSGVWLFCGSEWSKKESSTVVESKWFLRTRCQRCIQYPYAHPLMQISGQVQGLKLSTKNPKVQNAKMQVIKGQKVCSTDLRGGRGGCWACFLCSKSKAVSQKLNLRWSHLDECSTSSVRVQYRAGSHHRFFN